MSRQCHHKYVQFKVWKSMFHFIHQILYISTIYFIFIQSYFYYYWLLCFYLDIICHFEFHLLIISYYNILRLRFKISFIYASPFIFRYLVLVVFYSHPITVSLFFSLHSCAVSPLPSSIVFFFFFLGIPVVHECEHSFGSLLPLEVIYERSYYCHISSLFFSHCNGVVSLSP